MLWRAASSGRLRRWLSPQGNASLALLAAGATAPAWTVLPAALSGRASGFSQFTDQAVLELQVAHATRALHLLGPYSRFQWNHPGPLFFYLMAPLYALTGQASWSLWISAWLLNVACIAGIVWITGRTAGRLHAVLAFALLVCQTLHLGPENLCDPWGPYVVVYPFTLCLFASAAIASDHPRWLPVAVLAASFVVQTNLSAAAATLAALAMGPILGLWRAALAPQGEHESALEAFVARFGRWISPVILALGAGAAAWALPIIEELRSNPGNLTKLTEFAARGGGGHTLSAVLGVASSHVAAILPLEPDYRLHAFASAVRTPAESVAIAAPLLLTLLPVTAFLAASKKRTYTWSGSAVCAAAALAMLLAGRHIQGPLMSYLFLYASGIGAFSLFLLTGEVVQRAGEAARARTPSSSLQWLERRGGSALAAIVAAIAAAAWIAGRARMPEIPYFYGRPAAEIQPLADAIERHLKDEHLSHPVLRIGTGERWIIAAGVLLQLYKKRVPVSVERNWRFMFGEQFRPVEPADTFLVFGDAAYENLATEVVGCALLAQAGSTYVYGSPGAGSPQLPEGSSPDPCP